MIVIRRIQIGKTDFLKTIIATITKMNARVLRFYRKYGFALEDEIPLEGSDGMALMRKVGSEQSHPTEPFG